MRANADPLAATRRSKWRSKVVRSKSLDASASMKTVSVPVNDFITLKPIGGNQHHKQSQRQRQVSQSQRLKQWNISAVHQTQKLELLSQQRQDAEPGLARPREEHQKHPDAHGKQH